MRGSRTSCLEVDDAPPPAAASPAPAPPESSGSYRASGADSRAAPAGCGTSLREVRLEPETRNSRGADGAACPIGAQAPSTVDGGGAFGGPDSFTSL